MEDIVKQPLLTLAALSMLFFPALVHSNEQLPIDPLLESVDTNPGASVSSIRSKSLAEAEQAIAKLAAHLEQGVGSTAESRAQVSDALDQICQQRDCRYSKLYWHTDLDKAQNVAAELDRPILSLHLMGNLTDEFSCANSRFFRTVLYADPEVADVLREHFVLHWFSVRPVPRIEIDYGDGRKLLSTITGNSIHYILDQHGRPVDALPGLYGPKAFIRGILRSEDLAKHVAGLDKQTFQKTVRAYHAKRIKALGKDWYDDVDKVNQTVSQSQDLDFVIEAIGADPDAGHAAMVAISKAVVEVPTLESLGFRIQNVGGDISNERVWNELAELHLTDARLSRSSKQLMRSQIGQENFTKLASMIRDFEQSIALDTVKNEYQLHRRIHNLFANGFRGRTDTLLGLNEWVYGNLFYTPHRDPWIGLNPAAKYTGIRESMRIVR